MKAKQKKCFSSTQTDDFVNEREKQHDPTWHLKPSSTVLFFIIPPPPLFFLSLSHRNTVPPLHTSLQHLKGTLQIFEGFCVKVLKLYTSLSFSITTE